MPGSVGGLAVDPRNGDVSLSDRTQRRVRRVTVAGVVSTVLGDGTKPTASGLKAGEASLTGQPTGLFVGGDGRLYISEVGAARHDPTG